MNIRLLPCLSHYFTSCEKETELERIKREASQGDAEAQPGLAIIYDTRLTDSRNIRLMQSSGVAWQPGRVTQELNTILVECTQKGSGVSKADL